MASGGLPTVSAGNFYTAALKSDGSLWTWGHNGHGELGDGTTTDRLTPVQVGTGFSAIATSYDHTTAIKPDGSLWAWGYNYYGALGDGTTITRWAPVQIGTGFSTTAMGYNHSVALKPDGSLWGWGANYDGQLGDGTTTSRMTPVKIGTGYSSIAAGLDHTIALKLDGSLWAWGGNYSGQLGDGTRTNRLTPVQIGAGFSDIAAGHFHTVALKLDGTLWAWGYNAYGQLGNGTTTSHLAPVQIGSGFSAIAAGRLHTVALKPDGSLWGWGYNGYGELGTGSKTTRLTPAQIGTGFGQQSSSNVISLATGWNLAGNGTEASINVATTFDDATKVTSIWKWVVSGSRPDITYPTWAFFTPNNGSTITDNGAAYAVSRGYEVLTTINAGEGFWVNAKAAFSVTPPSGSLVQSSSFMPATETRALPRGWSLIATGDSATPNAFATAISATQPAVGQSATALTTLWAWNATSASWYFWAPTLVNNGGLASYLTSKGYLDFSTLPTDPAGTLSPSTGFWVNIP